MSAHETFAEAGTTCDIAKRLMLGAPSLLLWIAGGLGALSLLIGLANGSVAPGVDTGVFTLVIVWGAVVIVAAFGILFALYSLVKPVRLPILIASLMASFFSLFFSILSAS